MGMVTFVLACGTWMELDAKAVTAASTTVAHMLAGFPAGRGSMTMRLEGCTTQALDWICDHVAGTDVMDKMPTEDVTEDFVSLINIVKYLDISTLAEPLMKHAAVLLGKKTPDELRALCGIQPDLTPDQVTQYTKETEWIMTPTEQQRGGGDTSAACAAAAAASGDS